MSHKPQRLDIVYRLHWDGDWHVGSGFGTATIDRLVRRRGPQKMPFVPGSQLKGVLRHHCERLAATLDCPVVPPHALEARPVELIDNFQPLSVSKLLIDRLFGTRFEGGCLFVDDVESADAVKWDDRSHARTSIDRVTGTARDATLFVSEVVIGGGRALSGRIQARHPAGALTQLSNGFPYEYALLIAGLLTLDALGGNKSTGLGRCEVKIEDGGLKWNDQGIALKEALTSFAEDDWQDMLLLIREEASP